MFLIMTFGPTWAVIIFAFNFTIRMDFGQILEDVFQTKDPVDKIKVITGPLDDFVDEEIDCLEASIDEENKMA